jgi:membrane associated rhomboid family serine protease
MRRTWGPRGRFSGLNSWLPFSTEGIPVVCGVSAAVVVTFLLFFFGVGLRPALLDGLAFSVAGRPGLSWLLKPWTLLTYPILVTDFFAVLFGVYWFFVAGGTLERSWGSNNFAALLAAFVAITPVGFILAALLFDVPFLVAGLWIPLCSLTVAWAATDPEQELRLWGVIPIKMKLLALIFALGIYFNYGFSTGPLGPVIGLFALAGPAAAYYYVRKMPRLSLGYRAPRGGRFREPLLREPRARGMEREQVSRGFNPLRKRQEQLEIERLRKLLGDDDDRPISRR